MKAVVKANAEKWSLQVVERPVPKIGDGDVLVRIHATGVCYTDASILMNTYVGRKPVPIPMILGHEGAGEIVEAGPGVDRARIGERVALEPIAGCGHCDQCLVGNTNLCTEWDHIGITRDGTFAEYISIPAKQAHKIADHLEYAVAAVAEPFGLVVRSLEQAKFIVGETVAVVGPGSLGILHLLAFRAAGASKVIMVGLEQDAKRFETAKRLGADHTIMVDREDASKAVLEYTGGRGADVVIETANSPAATGLAFELTAAHGRVILFGLYPEARFSPVKMLRKAVTAYGNVGQVSRHFIGALRIMESGRIDFSEVVASRFSFNQAEAAFKAAKKGEAVKVIFEA